MNEQGSVCPYLGRSRRLSQTHPFSMQPTRACQRHVDSKKYWHDLVAPNIGPVLVAPSPLIFAKRKPSPEL